MLTYLVEEFFHVGRQLSIGTIYPDDKEIVRVESRGRLPMHLPADPEELQWPVVLLVYQIAGIDRLGVLFIMDEGAIDLITHFSRKSKERPLQLRRRWRLSVVDSRWYWRRHSDHTGDAVKSCQQL